MSTPLVLMEVVSNVPGSVLDTLAQTVVLGHGRLQLNITRPDGSLMRLDCMDMDTGIRAEYSAWSSQ